jgi:hypothetical protein
LLCIRPVSVHGERWCGSRERRLLHPLLASHHCASRRVCSCRAPTRWARLRPVHHLGMCQGGFGWVDEWVVEGVDEWGRDGVGSVGWVGRNVRADRKGLVIVQAVAPLLRCVCLMGAASCSLLVIHTVLLCDCRSWWTLRCRAFTGTPRRHRSLWLTLLARVAMEWTRSTCRLQREL